MANELYRRHQRTTEPDIGVVHYTPVGYTEDEVRRLVIELRSEYGDSYWDGNGTDLLSPFRALLDGGKDG